MSKILAASQGRLKALAVLAAPVVLVLVALVAAGKVEWRDGLAATGAVVAMLWLVLWRHFLKLDRLRSAVEALGRNEPDDAPSAAGAEGTVLCPGLETAIAQAGREQRGRRRQMASLVAGNEAILANLPDPLIMLDRSRRILRANPAATEIFGRRLDGLELAAVSRNPVLVEAIGAVLDGAAGKTIEFVVPGPIERFFRADVAGLPEPAPDGTVAIIALHDLTGLKRAEQLRADFVANASHELRTPLASLLGFVETLRGPARDDEEARDRFLGIMEQQGQRMARLIEDLLSLSRIEMQEHNPPTGRVDLERMLRGVASTLQIKAAEKDMTIEVKAEGISPVIGDQDELAQVFQNLMDNAVKYARKGTAVTVTAGPSKAGASRLGQEAVAVCVADRSDGIAREHLGRLTERFYRVDTARSRQLGGTGLGLAIVKHIVNRHRGALDIKSVEGQGSTFTVYLRAADWPSREVAAE